MPGRGGLATLLWRGLRRRCPACGRGRIFRSLLSLRRSCPDCDWRIEREPGAVTGAMYVVAILTQLFAAGLFVAIWLGTDWEPATAVAVALPVLGVVCLLALPVSRGLWAALDCYTDLATGETATFPLLRTRSREKGNRRGEAEDQPG